MNLCSYKDKYVHHSRTEQIQIVLSEHTNGYGRLFGGQLVEWIDIVAAVVARRHSNSEVTTALIDSLSFTKPAFLNDTIVLIGKLVYVGTTSMDVCVETYVESLCGDKSLINTAYITLVALDEKQNPSPVPRLHLESDEERKLWDEAVDRRRARKSAK